MVEQLDSDFARCLETRKSMFGYLFPLARGENSWQSAKSLLLLYPVEFLTCFEAIT